MYEWGQDIGDDTDETKRDRMMPITNVHHHPSIHPSIIHPYYIHVYTRTITT